MERGNESYRCVCESEEEVIDNDLWFVPAPCLYALRASGRAMAH